MTVSRFDEGASEFNRTTDVLVVCPSCSECAVSLGGRLSCDKCGYGIRYDSGKETWFGKVTVVYKGLCQNCLLKFSGDHTFDAWPNSNIFVARCPECSTSVPTEIKRWQKIQGSFTDSDFGLPLWLQTTCKNHVLWADNLSHIEFLENYIGSDLRQRQPNLNRSLASRLPNWMKQASHRKHVMAGLKRLRNKLPS